MEIEYIDIVGEDKDLPSDNPECYHDYPNLYRYYKSVELSQGFDVDDEALQDDDYFYGLQSVPSECLGDADVIESFKIAVEEFNRLKGTELEFLRAVSKSWYIGSGCTVFSYLTLECTDGCFYEAKLSRSKECILGIFRPAKHYPRKWENTEDGSLSLGSKSDSFEIGNVSYSDKSENAEISDGTPSSKSENSDIGDGTPSSKSENSGIGDGNFSSKRKNSEDGDAEQPDA